jgi:hypothetical protein
MGMYSQKYLDDLQKLETARSKSLSRFDRVKTQWYAINNKKHDLLVTRQKEREKGKETSVLDAKFDKIRARFIKVSKTYEDLDIKIDKYDKKIYSAKVQYEHAKEQEREPTLID